MLFSVSRPSSPPTPQSSQSRDYSGANNESNHGIIGNGSNNVVSNINQWITQVTRANAEEDVELDRLLDGSISKDALHNTLHSPPECHPGTRKTVCNEIRNWFNGSGSAKSPLLWLHGPAGVGKSVIAKTIAGRCHDQVVATFFFSTSTDRSAATLLPTLAWQLARKIPETKQYIIAALKNNASLLTSEIKEQFEYLITQPLKKCTITSTPLPVMVIDGVDECTDEYMLSRFLQALVCAGESGDMPLRFIICSRPESRIRVILKKINDHHETEVTERHCVPQRRSRLYWRPRIGIQLLLPYIRNRLYIPIIWGFRNPTLLLQEAWKLYRPVPLQLSGDTNGPTPDMRDDLFDRISPHPVISELQIGFSEECREDIARYLTDQFNATGHRHQLGELDISQLVNRSCGQFLYASTIVRLLQDSHPKDVLEMAFNSSLPTPDLNKLYNVILKRAQDAIRNRAQEGGPDYAMELKILMDTLAILIVFAENVHFFNMGENFAAIESLISIKGGRLAKKLCKMNSVLNVVDGKFISVYHRSFLEFLQSQKRSGEQYIAYTKALRRFLVLLSQAGLRYFVRDWSGGLRDNDRKMRVPVENMALACRRNYFKRSSSPTILIALHDLIHYSLPFICLVPFCQLIRQLKEYFIGAPTSSTFATFVLEYLFLPLLCLFILSSGSFIISLTIYTLLFNHSFILPLFHPLLHPYFATMVGILLSSPQASTLMSNAASKISTNELLPDKGADVDAQGPSAQHISHSNPPGTTIEPPLSNTMQQQQPVVFQPDENLLTPTFLPSYMLPRSTRAHSLSHSNRSSISYDIQVNTPSQPSTPRESDESSSGGKYLSPNSPPISLPQVQPQPHETPVLPVLPKIVTVPLPTEWGTPAVRPLDLASAAYEEASTPPGFQYPEPLGVAVSGAPAGGGSSSSPYYASSPHVSRPDSSSVLFNSGRPNLEDLDWD